MPTILVIAGWRIFFYSNENSEPIHVHAEKAEMEIKFWIDYIVSEWNNYFKTI